MTIIKVLLNVNLRSSANLIKKKINILNYYNYYLERLNILKKLKNNKKRRIFFRKKLRYYRKNSINI